MTVVHTAAADDGLPTDGANARCELKAGLEHLWPTLKPRLDQALAEGHGGLRFNVEQAQPGPRFELKARRLIDKRGV